MGSALSYFYSPSPLPLSSPSPSPSHPPSEIKYDVFLSFRGEDTRDKFTSHVDKAFRDKGIDHFIDYQLRRGDEISSSLLQAIEESRISVVIFSENYANSRWCLEELVKILQCKKNHGQIVIPIFYEIDPSHVRNQTGSYAAAFARHQIRFKDDLDKVQKWRCALKEAADLSGSDSRVIKPESVFIEKIVEDVLEKLNNMPISDNNKLVGIESRITEIEVMLGTADQMNNNVRKVGIYGIGGIGKTTLAKAVFDKICCQFEGFYFIGNVREASEKKELNRLKQELYSAIARDGNAYIYPFTKKRLRRKKLLIIFDDITSFKQMEDLIGDLDCFGSGSRIVITSRDRQVLKNCGMDDEYNVRELCFNDSLKLFCQYAFKQNCPKVDYKKLSKGLVEKIGGVPLALKVLGSFLLGKRKEVWESSMKKLENSLDNDIYEVLKISYDGLDPDQRRIFLDIACFYKGWHVNLVIAILDASGFYTANELSALTDKSLIIIVNNQLMMHDLLQAMGKRIVQQESIEPGERTRLWNHNDIYDILTKATGTKRIEGISLDMSNAGNIYLHPFAFVNMPNLRFLNFHHRMENNKVHIPQDLKFLLTELRYFEWEGCPLQSLQSNFHLKNLVILKLPSSNVEQLWSGVQQFDHLKEIDLSMSRNLIRFPDLKAPKLEYLYLQGCSSLIEMPSSFHHLARLMYLFLSSCINLRSVPQLPNNLKRIDLRDCSSLIEIASSIRRLAMIHLSFGTEREDLKATPNTYELYLEDGTSSLEIPWSIHQTWIHLSPYSKLQWPPEIPNNFEQIEFFGWPTEIPNNFEQIEFFDWTSLFEEMPSSFIPNNFEQIEFFDCTRLFEMPSSFKYLSNLKSLTFKGCKSLTSIPDLRGLKSLKHLIIDSCPELKELPEFPNSIQVLLLEKIPIEELPPTCKDLCTLLWLFLIDCPRLRSLPDSFCTWKSVQRLIIQRCGHIKLPHSITRLKSFGTHLCVDGVIL